MPLFEIPNNIMSKMESNGLKRSHDEITGDEVVIEESRSLEAGVKQQITEGVVQPNKAVSPVFQITRDSPPPQSSPASLTDAGTCTPARNSPSPNPTPTKNTSPLKQMTDANSASKPPASSAASSSQPPAKRKRRTAEEKEAEEKEKAQKKKEREEKKEAEEKEKAQKKKEREEEKKAKQAEKAKADAEKQAKLDEKRRKKEEEERKIREEKEKKERAQPKLMSFFTAKPPATPKKDQAAATAKTESPVKAATTSDSTQATPAKKEEKSEYEKRFKPFFVHETVRMAKSPFEMDSEALAAKSRILDEYFGGKRQEVEAGKFDPMEVFQLPCRPAPRGRIYPPVRYTMERMQKLTLKAEGASEEDRRAIMKETTDALSRIPMKTLRFYQDVRPPYKGTVTLRPYQAGKDHMRRLARNPTLRDLMPINYDHDSEAEWESEGEDVDVDDDDEEDLDGDDDMDEFLDDTEDNGPARFVSANGLEPVSTGLCWEDPKRKAPVPTTYEHRMEFILESVDHHTGIDPFATSYWEPEPKPKTTKQPKDKPAPTSAPTDAFQAITSTNNGPQPLPKKILENNHLQELKKVIQANPKIAKGGLVDLSYVALAHAKISRNDIKEAITAIAERNGRGASGSWVVKPLYDN